MLPQVVTTDFFRTLDLIKGLKHSKEHVFMKNGCVSVRPVTFNLYLTTLQLQGGLENQQPHNYDTIRNSSLAATGETKQV